MRWMGDSSGFSSLFVDLKGGGWEGGGMRGCRRVWRVKVGKRRREETLVG